MALKLYNFFKKRLCFSRVFINSCSFHLDRPSKLNLYTYFISVFLRLLSLFWCVLKCVCWQPCPFTTFQQIIHIFIYMYISKTEKFWANNLDKKTTIIYTLIRKRRVSSVPFSSVRLWSNAWNMHNRKSILGDIVYSHMCV